MTGADLAALLRKQPFASVCVFIALASAVAIYFRADAVSEAQAAYQAREDEAQKMELNVRHLAGLAEQTAELQESARQLEARVVRSSQLANNLQLFYRLENETGVRLLDSRQGNLPTPRSGAPRGLYVPVPFTVAAQGTFAQVHAFLHRLESAPHFLRLSQVTLTKLDAGRTDGLSTGQMSVSLNVEMLGTP